MELTNELYHPLDPGRREFRLVRILYTGSSEIECHLEVLSLDGTPVYTALSYAWTDDEASRQILLNGKAFSVRPNLHEFLKQMHAEQYSGWIFVDAICINQNDDAEKASQIGLMGGLFGTAQDVVAWQGVDFERKGRKVSVSEKLELDLEAVLAYCSGHPSDQPTPELQRRVYRALCAFFQWSYWSRVWIAQEVILARVLTMRFSRFRLGSGQALFLLRETLDHHALEIEAVGYNGPLPLEADRVFAGFTIASKLLGYREQFAAKPHGSRSITLSAAINMVASQECTIKYDTIYGTLGLTNSPLVADYAVPVLELFLRVLIEGVLVTLARQDSPVEERFMQLYTDLVLRLHLSPWHPVLAFTTMCSFKLHGIFTHALDCYLICASSAEFAARKIQGYPGPFDTESARETTRRRATRLKLQLRISQASHLRMRGPGDYGKGKTLEEWAGWFEDILKDVLDRLIAQEAKSSASSSSSVGRIQSDLNDQAETSHNTVTSAASIANRDTRVPGAKPTSLGIFSRIRRGEPSGWRLRLWNSDRLKQIAAKMLHP